MHSSPAQQSPFDSALTSFDNGNIPSPDSLSIALRKASHQHIIPSHYRHDIADFIFYESLSPAYRSFIASSDSTVIPSNWKEDIRDPKWKEAMLEEMRALAKNQMWELIPLRPRKMCG